MAITTVTNANLADYVTERNQSINIQNNEQLIAAVEKTGKTADPIVATGAETSPEAPPEPQADTETSKKGDKKDVQTRINELTRARKEAEEFAEDEYNAKLRAERRIGELEAQVDALKSSEPQQPKADVLKEPDPADFQDIGAFAKALTEYTRKFAEQQIAQAREEERNRVVMERQNELMKARVEAAKTEFEDFQEVIESADRVKIAVPAHVQAAIMESDFGPHIAYHLAKNPEDQARIFKLPAAKALLELGKIETSFEKSAKTDAAASTKAKPTIETTRAPAPVASIRGSELNVAFNSREALSFNDYKRLRIQELRSKRR